MEVRFDTDSEPICLDVQKATGDSQALTVRDGEGRCLEVRPLGGGWFRVHCPESEASDTVLIVADGDDLFAAWTGGEAELQLATRRGGSRRRPKAGRILDGAATGEVRAPMPGTIISVDVRAGDAVSRGSRVVALEAMKMEHQVRSPCDGVVARLLVSQGDSVDGGAVLVKIDPAEDATT